MKTFTLGAVLSVTTGRLLDDIGNLYEILGVMTSDSPFTHQFGRFSNECKPWLLRWFPELAEADKHLDNLDASIKLADKCKIDRKRAVDSWLERCIYQWGMKSHYEIGTIPCDDHDVKNPVDEMIEMRGTDEGVIVF